VINFTTRKNQFQFYDRGRSVQILRLAPVGPSKFGLQAIVEADRLSQTPDVTAIANPA
jgi:hypothetical protein